MNEQGPRIERRRHTRVYVRGPATVRGRHREVPGYVVAVSETTLEIRCQLRSALLAMAGASVEVEMRVDGQIGERPDGSCCTVRLLACGSTTRV